MWDDNGKMLEDFLVALEQVNGNGRMKRVVLQTGAKHYGVHLGEIAGEAQEDDRTPSDGPYEGVYNFYYRWVIPYPVHYHPGVVLVCGVMSIGNVVRISPALSSLCAFIGISLSPSIHLQRCVNESLPLTGKKASFVISLPSTTSPIPLYDPATSSVPLQATS